ncbi:MAG: LPS assembly lipoprotein LptE [Kiritimatiellia bacterium]
MYQQYQKEKVLRRGLAGMLTLLLLTGCGCVGYRLGSTLPSDIRSIFIPIFANLSGEPLVEFDLTNTTIEEFQRDGTLQIARMDEADIVLRCTLTRISLDPLRYDRGDRSTPNEYRLRLDVNYTLQRRSTRERVSEGTVSGETTFVFAGNLTLAKKNAIPRAAEDLAKNLVQAVVEVW